MTTVTCPVCGMEDAHMRKHGRQCGYDIKALIVHPEEAESLRAKHASERDTGSILGCIPGGIRGVIVGVMIAIALVSEVLARMKVCG